jgi:ADP-ribose pyrophosphatase YjhB (NUDIX family)
MNSNKSFNFCNNCGKVGHLFQNCKHPITSIGIINFRFIDNEPHFLMIRRKHSLGFVEFMRGKYPMSNYSYLLNIFNEMTCHEKHLINTQTFDELWKYLWGDYIGIQYRGEEKISREKFNSLKEGIDYFDLEKIINDSNSVWEEPEWGFPKGRRNYQEKDLTCALREFEEETGYSKSNVQLIQNIIPYEEIFTGSNMKSYKHKYFLGFIDPSVEPINDFQQSEISDVKWLSYNDCIKKIRPYNLEKIKLINNVKNVLQQYRLY